MNTEQIRPVSVIPLRYITDIQQYQKAANGHDDHNLEPTTADEKMPISSQIGTGQKFRADTVYLLLTSNGKAISLGSGRYATVVLGADRNNYEHPNTGFLAVKFLKQDVESLVASKIARTRFYEEIEKTREIRQLEGAFVAYKGFSSYRSVKVEKHDTRSAENLRSTFGEKDIQAVVSDNERRRDAIEQAVSANLQGEFYVMQAESGTLDDLLIYKQPWDSRGLEGVRKSLASESSPDPLGLFRENRRDDLKDLVRRLNLEGFVKRAQDFSGFAILKEIGEHRPKERNRMVVELFREILHSIRFVHTAKLGDEGYLAHRDLKPGNFLIRCNFPGLTLLTSDLGFVSGSEKENLGAKTMAVSTREPGVLAPGSYMFRSPEQLEQGYEINFQVETENTESVSTSIAFDNIGDKNIELGDWFESDAVCALDGTTPFNLP